MRIKNNSKHSWERFNVGRGHFVDVPAGEVIEVNDYVGKRLLHLLGSEAWLVLTDEKVTYPKKKKKEAATKKKKKGTTTKETSKTGDSLTTKKK